MWVIHGIHFEKLNSLEIFWKKFEMHKYYPSDSIQCQYKIVLENGRGLFDSRFHGDHWLYKSKLQKFSFKITV